jgi:hypothetical protein
MEPETQRTVILTLGPIVVALITGIGARILISRPPKPEAGPTDGTAPITPPSPLERFSGTENKFVEMVLEDSRHRARELAQFRRDADERHETLRMEVEGLRTELGAKTLHQNAFERAIRHYLAIVVTVVQTLGGQMPEPEPEDRELLEPILPNLRKAPK